MEKFEKYNYAKGDLLYDMKVNPHKYNRVEKAPKHGIDYTPAICTNKKECSGTCPVCEMELEYINSFYFHQ